MCYKGKIMHCLEVETGALIFAILNVVLTSLGTVLSIGGLVYILLFMDETIREAVARSGESEEILELKVKVIGVASNLVFAMMTVGFCIAFAFAVVLIVGLCKRKAALVKCYFVYGITKIVCGVAVMIMLALNLNTSPVFGSFILLLFIMNSFYGLIVYMVRMTYKKFESEVPYDSFSKPIATIQKF